MSAEQKAIEDADAREMQVYRLKMQHRGWCEADGVRDTGWYWWWDEDPDAPPLPVSVLYSHTNGTYFASRGQLGWTRPQDVLDMRGWWMPLSEPQVTKHPFS